PNPIPPMTPQNKYSKDNDCKLVAKPDPATPTPKNRAAIMPDVFGPFRSTNRPIKAADVPKKKIARLKASEICVVSHPYWSASGLVKTLHAYADPIVIWIPTADVAMSLWFFPFCICILLVHSLRV